MFRQGGIVEAEWYYWGCLVLLKQIGIVEMISRTDFTEFSRVARDADTLEAIDTIITAVVVDTCCRGALVDVWNVQGFFLL